MFSKLQIANLGLSKIASSRISRLDPPVSKLEHFVQDGYDHWKRTEIAKRRWVFATEDDYALAKVDTLTDVARPYKYSLPADCLRPVRLKRTEWKQRRRFIYSANDNLKISYIMNVDEADFDPLFVEVLACRVAQECVEFVTQSNQKKEDTFALYNEAVKVAGQANAFVIGPEDIKDDDEDFEFITARY
jgi:hypothetical protein